MKWTKRILKMFFWLFVLNLLIYAGCSVAGLSEFVITNVTRVNSLLIAFHFAKQFATEDNLQAEADKQRENNEK